MITFTVPGLERGDAGRKRKEDDHSRKEDCKLERKSCTGASADPGGPTTIAAGKPAAAAKDEDFVVLRSWRSAACFTDGLLELCTEPGANAEHFTPPAWIKVLERYGTVPGHLNPSA